MQPVFAGVRRAAEGQRFEFVGKLLECSSVHARIMV